MAYGRFGGWRRSRAGNSYKKIPGGVIIKNRSSSGFGGRRMGGYGARRSRWGRY